MNFIVRLILIAGLGYFIPFYTPWWSLMIISFFVGVLVYGNGFGVFNSGFLGGGLVWLILSFKLDTATQGVISSKIVQLFPLSDSTQLIMISGVIGGVAAGISALAGNSFRHIFIKKAKKSLYS